MSLRQKTQPVERPKDWSEQRGREAGTWPSCSEQGTSLEVRLVLGAHVTGTAAKRQITALGTHTPHQNAGGSFYHKAHLHLHNSWLSNFTQGRQEQIAETNGFFFGLVSLNNKREHNENKMSSWKLMYGRKQAIQRLKGEIKSSLNYVCTSNQRGY